MKTAMFVLAIIEIVFIIIAFILHNIEIDLNDWTDYIDFDTHFVVFVLVSVSLALSILAIISKFI